MLCSVAVLSFGQPMHGVLTSSNQGVDRLSLVRTSLDLPPWHERNFWPVYESYVQKIQENSESYFRSLNDLANINVSSGDALNTVQNFFEFRNKEISLLKEYYQKIGTSCTGTIALQFLQTEIMLDMVESSAVYDQSRWRKYRFYAAHLPEEQASEAKRNTMRKALAIPIEQSEHFWKLYSSYEEECAAMLGDNYDLIGQFGGEATDYTPALAKRLGYNLLSIVERDTRLKEKYFQKISELCGVDLAVNFLAWEDYYSLVNKMHAWAEAQ